MILVDVHTHLDHADFRNDLDQVVQRARQAGVKAIITNGINPETNRLTLEIANKYDIVKAALGIYPIDALQKEIEIGEYPLKPNIFNVDEEIKFIQDNKQNIIAIGEIGLDHYFVKNEEIYTLQKKIFEAMLNLAQDLNLPVNLHTKGAERLVFETLPSYNVPNINIHWYSGPENFLKLGIDRGYYFSITPAISYSPAVKKTVLKVEKEFLLLESDGPVKYSGNIGTPAMIRDVLKSVSTLKQIPFDELEHQIYENTRRIFPKIF